MAAELVDLEDMTKKEVYLRGMKRGEFLGALKAAHGMKNKLDEVLDK